MASKKSSKKSSSKKASTTSAATLNATLLASSAAESEQDAKESAILQCLITCFFNNGLPPLSPSAKIVWSTIPDNIIIIIGNCVRDCINGKGFQSPGWAGPFLNLKEQNRVSVVSTLVAGMATLVTP
jgi:hypothetical protein